MLGVSKPANVFSQTLVAASARFEAMWCTRWYLPLILLPIPVAPPYYLLLFLFSTTMHARPCFYCMVLLTAMFMSTCYWPPVPIETQLVQPWSNNVTTFADALHAIMPNIPEENIPSTIPVADRCWCDLSNGFFVPFNTSRWEELSVIRLKDKLEKEIVAEQRAKEKEECQIAEGEEANSSACDAADAEELKSEAPLPSAFEEIWGSRTLLEMLWDAVSAYRHRRVRPTATSMPSSTTKDEDTESVPLESEVSKEVYFAPEQEASSPTSSPELSVFSSSWFRREYDLRNFGFAMVLDFGWPGSP